MGLILVLLYKKPYSKQLPTCGRFPAFASEYIASGMVILPRGYITKVGNTLIPHARKDDILSR